MFLYRFDMRAPETGAPARDLYSAAIEMVAWGEGRGLMNVTLSEHHGSGDGYLPAPMILASAMAARTDKVGITLAILQIPLYDPIRLAEHMAVLDIISGGRVSYVGGLGYLPSEYEASGVDFGKRGKIAEAYLALLLQALKGEPFEHEGRRIHITPRSLTPGGPTVFWGGGSAPAARRAGRYGLGFLAQCDDAGLREAYEQACAEYGHSVGPCILPPRNAATTTFVAEDVDAAWEELGPYLMHDVLAYAEWNEGRDASSLSSAKTIDDLRAQNTTHRILSVEEAIAQTQAGVPLALHPLVGGLPPEIAWKYLMTVSERVMPVLARS